MNDADARRRVFLVHGRDEQARKSVEALIRALDLKVIPWRRAAELAGGGAPYTGDIVKAGMDHAHGVVVLLTPDDLGHLKPEFLSDRDGPDERQPTGQPRMNVIFEAGMALGISRDRVVIVEVGAVRRMSDIDGINVIRLDDSVERRRDFAGRLRAAGLAVDMEDDAWRTAGTFTPGPPVATVAPPSAAPRTESDTGEAYREFWRYVLDVCAARPDLSWVRTRVAPAQNWVVLASDGRGGQYIVNFARRGRMTAQYYIGGPSADANLARFRTLHDRRAGIEARFGGPLAWEDLPDRKACRVGSYTDGSVLDRDKVGAQADWLLTTVNRLRDAIIATEP